MSNIYSFAIPNVYYKVCNHKSLFKIHNKKPNRTPIRTHARIRGGQ